MSVPVDLSPKANGEDRTKISATEKPPKLLLITDLALSGLTF